MAGFLVLCNAFFVAAEFSFVRIRKTKVEELVQNGNKNAKLLLHMINSLDIYLSTVQLGVTLFSLGLGWMGEPAIASLLTVLISNYVHIIPAWMVSTVSFAIGFFLITFLQIVLGELVPRGIVLSKVEFIALHTARPIYFFYHLTYPVVKFFNKSAKMILKLFSIDNLNNKGNTHSFEELRMIVSFSEQEGVIDKMESQIIDNVFEFSERMAREIMVPRQDVAFLYEDKSLEENLEIMRETKHTRYPVCQYDKDHVVGLVHIRDIMDMLLYDTCSKDIKNVTRNIVVVPEGMQVTSVLKVLQEKHMQMAVVADEYGGTAGIITIEDLLEEIVGDIKDEYDKEEEEIVTNPDGSYEFDGLVLVDTVESVIDVELTEHDEDTIGGYIFGLIGRKPVIGEKINVANCEFEILKAEGFRVQRVKVYKLPEPIETNDE